MLSGIVALKMSQVLDKATLDSMGQIVINLFFAAAVSCIGLPFLESLIKVVYNCAGMVKKEKEINMKDLMKTNTKTNSTEGKALKVVNLNHIDVETHSSPIETKAAVVEEEKNI